MPQGLGDASGTFATEPVDARWSIVYHGLSDMSMVAGTVAGTLAGVVASLSGTFKLAPDFLFESGTITGMAGGSPVQAHATNAPGESSSSVNVQGDYAGSPFSLYGTLSGDLSSGYVQGTVAGKPFKVSASGSSQIVDLTGNYSGPPDLLALIVGALLYFIG